MRITAPLIPTASASARFLLEHGAYGSRRKGTEWEYARHPKRLSPTQAELHGFGGATEGSRRSYGANLVLQAAPSLDLARMQEADRVTPWHRRFRHWVFRTGTRTSPDVPDNGKVRTIRVCETGSRERLRPIISMRP